MTIFLVLVLYAALLVPGCSKKKIDTAPTPIAKADPSQHKKDIPEEPPAKPPEQLQEAQPAQDEQTFSQVGAATWFGPEKQGKLTASGEPYDMDSKTAAHRSLPIGALVEVTNLSNGKSTTVVINDRGPRNKDHVLGLSRSAANEIGLGEQGTTIVRITTEIDDAQDEPVFIETTELQEEALGDIDKPDEKSQEKVGSGNKFYIQVGSFTEKDKAEKVLANLIDCGHKEARIVRASVKGKEFYRVQAGVFPDNKTAEKAKQRLQKEYPESFILTD
jgi:rare lipoprotein A